MTTSPSPGSLQGIRVVDVTTSIAGPFATQLLGDLGADVVKVERPGNGDDARRWGPPFWAGESVAFQAFNRNKRSLELDLKNDEDTATLRVLLSEADVVVQNLRPGVFAKLGFDYETIRSLNPGIIYCEITGYGDTGPLKDRPAYDPLLQAFSGLMSLTGEEGRAPARIPASLLDQGSAMWAVIGILDALRKRDATGEGSLVQTSLLGTALMWLPSQFMAYIADGTVPPRLGSGTVGIAPYEAFPTSDGWVMIAAGNDNLWSRLCKVIDREELMSDPRFLGNPDRVQYRHELSGELASTLRQRDSATWIEALTNAGVPVTLIQTLNEVVAHPQVEALGAFQPVEHARIDGFHVVNTPIRVDGVYYPIRKTPPFVGEGGNDVVREWATRDEAGEG